MYLFVLIKVVYLPDLFNKKKETLLMDPCVQTKSIMLLPSLEEGKFKNSTNSGCFILFGE